MGGTIPPFIPTPILISQDDCVFCFGNMSHPTVTSADLEFAKHASNSLGIPVHVIVTDLNQLISYVNPSFESFTGFTKEEVVGKKCNFLQGKLTDPQDLYTLSVAVQNQRETSVVILNYTKSKRVFWNTLRIRPIFTKLSHELSGYVGEIFSFPVNEALFSSRPKLCLDDALALMRMASSVPPPLSINLQEPITRHTPTAAAAGVVVQRHVNYAKKFASPLPESLPPLEENLPSSEVLYEFVAETLLPTKQGLFRMRAYRDNISGAEPLAIIVGDVESQRDGVLVRVHDQCQTSEVFGSLKCDCKEQLDFAMQKIQKEGGMVLYLPQEGRGIGLANKVAAYAAQHTLGLDTVDANRHLGLPDDCREYHSVRDILKDLNIASIRLMTNNPRKITELTNLGINVAERVPIETLPNSDFSQAYVQAKRDRMSHMFAADL